MNDVMSRTGSAGVDDEGPFALSDRLDGPLHVVEMSGALDLLSRDAALHACTSGDRVDVLVDLTDLAFMDCAGYGAFAAATVVLERRGGSLVVVNPVGEVRMLLTLIEDLELGAVCSERSRFGLGGPR